MLHNNPHLWTPGIKLGVKPNSFFHQTECFGPVLGLMRAKDLTEAIALANQVSFGLTSGLHSLDDREIEQWKESIEAGNLYINRHITGAIVRRQPFGGWKASVVGPGAKAGGPNYVLQMGHWRQNRLPVSNAVVSLEVSTFLAKCVSHLGRQEPLSSEADVLLSATMQSYAEAWQTHFKVIHDPSQVLGEENLFRYQPCPVVIRIGANAPTVLVTQALLAARTVQRPLTISIDPSQQQNWGWLAEDDAISLTVEDETALATRLADEHGLERLRLVGTISESARRAANLAGVAVVDSEVVANGRIELRLYLREQAISHTTHRYGNLMMKGTR